MKQKGKSFIAKIIVSYLVAAVACIFIVWYFFTNIIPLISSEDDKKDIIYEKIALISSSVLSLHEIELRGLILVQDPSEENREAYNTSVNKIYQYVDSLKLHAEQPDEQEVLRILLSLLNQKHENMLAIAEQINSDNDEKIIRRSLSTIISSSLDTVPFMVQLKENLQHDTLRNKSEKRKFLQRVGDVFVPPTNDTTTQIKTSHTQEIDTLRGIVNTYDTLVNTIQKVLGDIYLEKTRNKQSISDKLQELLDNDKIINIKISTLMRDLRSEAMQASLLNIDAKQKTLQEAGCIIIVVGLFSVALIILFIIFIFHDFRRSKTYQKELEIARTRAEELMQSREKLLLTISHDIKAPLSSIAGYIELMQSSPLNATDREYMNSMNYSIQHVMALLSNLLEYSRLDANKVTLVPEEFSLHSLFEETTSVFFPLAKKKNLKLIIDNSIDSTLFVELDRIRLQQVLTNLLSNALKFTDKGSVSVKAILEKRENETWLQFTVSDTGCGIPENMAQTIFEEFAQVNSIKNQQKGGSGFGLFIVKRTLDLFCGNISVAPNKPNGSTFTVQLPLKIVSTPQNFKTIETKKEIAPTQVARKILVLDDDLSQLKLLEKIIENIGHSAIITTKIDDAIKLLQQHHFDLVMTDIHLTDETGFQLLEAIKSLDDAHLQTLPIIAISATDGSDRNYFLENGFSDFIRKPFSIDEFRSTINIFFEEKPLYDLNQLNVLMDNDSNAVNQVLKMFVSSGEEHIVQLKNLLNEEKFSEIKSLAHKMRPMVAQINALETADLLRFIEFYDNTPENSSLFKEKVNVVINQIENLLRIVRIQ